MTSSPTGARLFADLGYVFGATTPSKIKPYIRFGAGVMQHRYSAGGGYSDDESETKAGGAIGAGINYVMEREFSGCFA